MVLMEASLKKWNIAQLRQAPKGGCGGPPKPRSSPAITMTEQPDEEFLGGLIVGWASGEAEEIVQPAAQRRRYFPATAMAGRLDVEGIPDRGP